MHTGYQFRAHCFSYVLQSFFKILAYNCKILCVCRVKAPDAPFQALYKTSPHHSKASKPIDLCSRSGKKIKTTAKTRKAAKPRKTARTRKAAKLRTIAKTRKKRVYDQSQSFVYSKNPGIGLRSRGFCCMQFAILRWLSGLLRCDCRVGGNAIALSGAYRS